MADMPDDFFSPERLREKWTKKEKESTPEGVIGNEKALSAGSNDSETLLINVRELLSRRFSGERLLVLETVMDEVKIQLDLNHDPKITDDEMIGVNGAIDQLLAHIEDLVEGFEIQDKTS